MSPLLLALALAVGAPQAKDPAKKDEPTLAGEWVIEALVRNGKAHPTPTGGITFLAAGKVVFTGSGPEVAGTYRSDPAKDPPEVDLTVPAGDTTATLLGIYRFEKGTLTLCVATAGPRPKRFEAPVESAVLLFTLKPAPKAKE